nr:response regulator [uncultured Desulfuromonas sp.]
MTPQIRTNARILLVEDNLINQDVAKSFLDDVDLNIEIASNGKEAVEMVKTTDYDLVLMDVQMPVMDGIEATRQIRQLFPEKKLTIIAMTANVFTEDQQQCFDAGMDDFIAKPIDPDVLYQKLAHWL